MSNYVIKTVRGTEIVVNEGSVNLDSTSLVFVGKNYAGYGAIQNENFLHLLENFANNTKPQSPITGQLWFDTSSNRLKYCYDGDLNKFTNVGVIVSATQPDTTELRDGDAWWDTSAAPRKLFKVWNGTSFDVVGPFSPSEEAATGSELLTIIEDGTGVPKTVIGLKDSSSIEFLAIISGYSTFSVDPADPMYSQFTQIKQGFNVNSAVLNFLFDGTSAKVENSVTFNASGSGASSGSSFNGAQNLTISHNSIGAQALLVSGTNIKTVNGESILGSGNIDLSGIGTGTVTQVSGTGTVNGISLSGTVTSSGSLTLSGSITGLSGSSFGTINAKRFFAAPALVSGQPSFRLIEAADLPGTITSSTSGKSGSVNNINGNGNLTFWTGTQAQYNAITPNATTLYIITG